jgi:AcrR family transcriptional regulator
MPGSKGGNYGGVSAAVRQEDRRRRLLEAGLEVIGTQGWSAATVRAVCRQAGLTSRFFYESFTSVEELALSLFDEIFDRTIAAVISAVESAPRDPRARNRIAIETFVEQLTTDQRVARFVFMEALGSQVLTRRRLAVIRAAVQATIRQVGPHGPAGVSPIYREISATVLIGGLAELLIGWMHGEIEVELSQLVEDYVQLVTEVGDATFGKARRMNSPTQS